MTSDSLDSFIHRFNGLTEAYSLYGGKVQLYYEPKGHIYYRVIDGQWFPQDGVTTVCRIIDKSMGLVPWACKEMADKILSTVQTVVTADGVKLVPTVKYEEFERLVITAKSAHKDTLDDASDVGGKAHAWIEKYIKAIIANNYSLQKYLMTAMPEDARASNCCVASLDWMRRHNVRWLCTERKIYSCKYFYAGTMDGLCLADSCDNKACCPVGFRDRLSLIDWKTGNDLHREYLLQIAAYKHAYQEETLELINDLWVIRLGKEDAAFDPWHIDCSAFEHDFETFLHTLELYRDLKQTDERMKQWARVRREANKVIAAKEREEALKIKCKGADKYKGIRKPACNKGNPCQTCLQIYSQRQAMKGETK